MDYEDYRDEAAAHAEQGESARAVERRLRPAVLREKRQAVTEMRDANEIDNIVLRELQAGNGRRGGPSSRPGRP